MKKLSTKPTKVVTIGGGSGQSLLLRHLQRYHLDITAIVSMVDNGGSTGMLINQLGVMPVGDLRRCIAALAPDSHLWNDVLNHRFGDGHTIGNLILAGLELKHGSAERAVQQLSRWLKIKGRVLPVTNTPTTLYAKLFNGVIVKGETDIDKPNHQKRSPIRTIYIKPKVSALPAVLKAIQQADYVVFSIGDLYTSVLPNVLVTGVAEALHKTKARLVYACNRTTKQGETDRYTAADYINTLTHYVGRSIDDLILDKTILTDHTTPHLVQYNKIGLEQAGIVVHEVNLKSKDPARIDGKKLAAAVYRLCQQ